MQANRSCSGVPIPPEEVRRRELQRQLKRQRAAAAYRSRRAIRHIVSRDCVITSKSEPEIGCRSSPETRRDEERNIGKVYLIASPDKKINNINN